jgi:hypothetical protein
MASAQHLLMITSVFSFLFGGCNKQPQQPQLQAKQQKRPAAALTKSPEITSESEEGFRDLIFYIQEHKKVDGRQTLRGSGTHKGRQLGLEVILDATWKAASLGKDIPFATYRGTLTYRSIGPESDAFLQVLDELYGTKLSPKTMSAETRFTAISLGGDPRDLAREPVKIKLFFESGGQNDYAELFTNIELATHRLEIREKDESYRSPVVRALRAR